MSPMVLSGKAPPHWMELNLDQFNSSHLFLQVFCWRLVSAVLPLATRCPLSAPQAPAGPPQIYTPVSGCDLTCVSSPDQPLTF